MDLTAGLLMGILYAAAPGPITIETLRQGVRRGFIPALAVQTGSSLGLIGYALLAVTGAGLLLQASALPPFLGLAGMALLFYLGLTSIRDRRKVGLISGLDPSPGASTRPALLTGAILSLANPLDFLFWLSIGSTVLRDPAVEAPMYLAGLLTGCLLSALFTALFASLWHARLTARALETVSWLSGLALITFGLKLGFSLAPHFPLW
jgi:threonine/homoserine/homoserine lactone efflux protein